MSIPQLHLLHYRDQAITEERTNLAFYPNPSLSKVQRRNESRQYPSSNTNTSYANLTIRVDSRDS